MKQVNREIKIANRARQKVKDNGSVACQKCGGAFYDGAHKCPRCGVHVAYVGGSFFDNWPTLAVACCVSVIPLFLSIGQLAIATVLAVCAASFAALRFYLPKLRYKNKIIVRRKLDFQLWMLAYLIPALMLAYSLADIEIAYK